MPSLLRCNDDSVIISFGYVIVCSSDPRLLKEVGDLVFISLEVLGANDSTVIFLDDLDNFAINVVGYSSATGSVHDEVPILNDEVLILNYTDVDKPLHNKLQKSDRLPRSPQYVKIQAESAFHQPAIAC